MSYNLSNAGFKVGSAAPYVVGGTDVALADGGTGASDAAGARSNLGLGSMATQSAGAVAITGGTITGLSAPSGLSDAATKSYVDNVATGLDVKKSVRVAAAGPIGSGNFAYANGTAGVGATLTSNVNEAIGNVDGVGVSVGNRILIHSISGPDLKVGIYTVTDAGSGSTPWILTRATDFDEAAEVSGGAFTFIEEGSTFAECGFVCTVNGAVTMGTTAMEFVQFSQAGVIQAGNGLVKSANTIDVNAGDGIELVSDQVRVKITGSTLTRDGAGLKVSNDGIGSPQIAAAAVSAGKIAVGGVSASDQIADGIVATAKLANNAVTQAKMANDSVGSAQIINGEVGTNELADGAVITNKLANNAVQPSKADLSLGWTFTGALTANGGLFKKVTVSTTNITVGATDTVVAITDTTAPRTVTLPAISGNTGRVLVIKDATGAASTNNITVDGNASETIDGATTYVINTNYGSVTLVADVGGWYVV